jgi:hypothetical protein
MYMALLPSRLASGVLLLIAALFTMGSGSAQVALASYPLVADLNDATLNFGPLALNGPAPPGPGGICLNGIYLNSPGGQDARTPNIGTLDANDFELEIEFQVGALHAFQRPVIIGGNGWRWIGIYVHSDGRFGLLHNNASYEWSTTTVTVGTWHTGILRYEAGTVELLLDGAIVHQAAIGPLNTGNDLCFTTNNFSNGTNLDGCIRGLVISNDATLGSSPSLGDSYCPLTPNSAGPGAALIASGSASVMANNLVFTAGPIAALEPGIVYYGPDPIQVPFGNGNRCVGGAVGTIVRVFPFAQADTSGTFTQSIDNTLPAHSQIVPGATLNFQAWFRDPAGGGAGFNLSDATEITFTP